MVGDCLWKTDGFDELTREPIFHESQSRDR